MKLSFILLMIVAATLAACATKQNSSFSPCRQDFEKFCSKVVPGDGRVRDCMFAQKDNLSKECNEYSLKRNIEHDQKFMPTMNVCHPEDEKFCGNVERFAARRINCLKKNYLKNPESFSPKCRESFSQVIKFIPSVWP